MMQTRVKKIKLTIVLIVISIAMLIGFRSFIFDRLKHTLEDKILSLNKTSLNIRYNTIHVDWWKNIITIDELVIEKDAYDTTCIYPEFISAKQVRISGFELLSFILNEKINVESVHVAVPHIVIRKQSSLMAGSPGEEKNEALINISRVQFQSAHLEYTDSASCEILTECRTNVDIEDLRLDLRESSRRTISMHSLYLDSTETVFTKQMYTLHTRAIKVNLSKGIAHVDTTRIIPHDAKLAFGKRLGHETDRIEGIVPFINISGIDLHYTDTLAFAAKKIEIQMYLKIFRDKRLPDKKKYTLLPVQRLRNVPLSLAIDTFQIKKSYVAYEEFAEGAETAGTVFFDNLFASIYGITNSQTSNDDEIIMDAQADFMGKGHLETHAIFPLKPGAAYRMEGSLTDFQMAEINSIMEPVANLKVESGHLNKLGFEFLYDAAYASGEIELNYRDLKLASFKDEEKLKKAQARKKGKNKNEDDLKKDNLKTFILNAFIIRKNMDEKVPEEKRTGTINQPRNTSRSIFNYWWKSVFSGIKSAYNIDEASGKGKMLRMKTGKRKKKNHKFAWQPGTCKNLSA